MEPTEMIAIIHVDTVLMMNLASTRTVLALMDVIPDLLEICAKQVGITKKKSCFESIRLQQFYGIFSP